MTPTQQPEHLLDIRERPNGDVVIKRYPFETVFNKEEWEELCNYCSRPAPAPGGSECEAAVNIKYCRHVIEAEGRGERAATLKAIGEDARILNEWGYPAAAAILSNEKERERVLKSLRRQQAGEQE